MSIPTIEPDREVLDAMKTAGINRDQLTVALEIRYGTLSSKLSGRNAWQPGERERALEICRAYALEKEESPRAHRTEA